MNRGPVKNIQETEDAHVCPGSVAEWPTSALNAQRDKPLRELWQALAGVGLDGAPRIQESAALGSVPQYPAQTLAPVPIQAPAVAEIKAIYSGNWPFQLKYVFAPAIYLDPRETRGLRKMHPYISMWTKECYRGTPGPSSPHNYCSGPLPSPKSLPLGHSFKMRLLLGCILGGKGKNHNVVSIKGSWPFSKVGVRGAVPLHSGKPEYNFCSPNM